MLHYIALSCSLAPLQRMACQTCRPPVRPGSSGRRSCVVQCLSCSLTMRQCLWSCASLVAALAAAACRLQCMWQTSTVLCDSPAGISGIWSQAIKGCPLAAAVAWAVLLLPADGSGGS